MIFRSWYLGHSTYFIFSSETRFYLPLDFQLASIFSYCCLHCNLWTQQVYHWICCQSRWTVVNLWCFERQPIHFTRLATYNAL